jgi:hypothetical protein
MVMHLFSAVGPTDTCVLWVTTGRHRQPPDSGYFPTASATVIPPMISRPRAGDNLFPCIRAFFFSLNLVRAGQQRIGYAVDQMSVSSTASSSPP